MNILCKIIGHKFEVRYSYGNPTITSVKGDPEQAIKIVKESKPKTYVCDVCVRCGMIVKQS